MTPLPAQEPAHRDGVGDSKGKRSVALRRIVGKRAKPRLQQGGDLSLAGAAACAGFSDQSQFCRHFKRLVGVAPGQFRTPARIA
jgi:AraC-like DNA-binding protein